MKLNHVFAMEIFDFARSNIAKCTVEKRIRFKGRHRDLSKLDIILIGGSRHCIRLRFHSEPVAEKPREILSVISFHEVRHKLWPS